MKKLMAMMMAIVMLAAVTLIPALAEEAATALYPDVKLQVTLYDTVSGRAVMTLTAGNDGMTDVEISWANSAEEEIVWSWCFEDTDEAVAPYENAVCVRETFDEDGVCTMETLYEDGTGSLTRTDEGVLWKDDKEDAGSNCIFVEDMASLAWIWNLQDTESQRAAMTIVMPMLQQENGDLGSAQIVWGESADTTRVWMMTLNQDPDAADEDAGFIYTDAICYVMKEDGVELLYDNGTGRFESFLTEEGIEGVNWISDMGEETCSFVPVMVEGPAMIEEGDEESSGVLVDQPFFIESVGTMDDVEETIYCVDGQLYELDDSGDAMVLNKAEDGWQRLVLNDDMVAIVPEDLANVMESEDMVLDSAQAFADWWYALNPAENCPGLCFSVQLDEEGNVDGLFYWYIEN